MVGRTLVWFSCGASSAVAAKYAVDELPNVVVVNNDMRQDEHPDNERFFDDVQTWINQDIIRLKGEYDSIDDVFEQTGYMSGIAGARCTLEMKKQPRRAFQQDSDTHILGFTADEPQRIEFFTGNNPHLKTNFILADKGITKSDCEMILFNAGIALPVMYQLGFAHNNCLGCVKATSPDYWLDTKKHFPMVFDKRVRQSEKLGVKLVRVKGERIKLSELRETHRTGRTELISCGLFCG